MVCVWWKLFLISIILTAHFAPNRLEICFRMSQNHLNVADILISSIGDSKFVQNVHASNNNLNKTRLIKLSRLFMSMDYIRKYKWYLFLFIIVIIVVYNSYSYYYVSFITDIFCWESHFLCCWFLILFLWIHLILWHHFLFSKSWWSQQPVPVSSSKCYHWKRQAL